jgi:hypothetical protein
MGVLCFSIRARSGRGLPVNSETTFSLSPSLTGVNIITFIVDCRFVARRNQSDTIAFVIENRADPYQTEDTHSVIQYYRNDNTVFWSLALCCVYPGSQMTTRTCAYPSFPG